MATIYALICDANEKAYVGCTKGKLAKRMREHRCLLNKKNHSVTPMVNDWHEFGENVFRMVVLEALPTDAHVDLKREREKFWMAEFNDKGLLYNTDMRSFELSPEQNRKGVEASRRVPKYFSPEALMRKRMSQLGIPKGHGAKISATKRANRLNRDEIVLAAPK